MATIIQTAMQRKSGRVHMESLRPSTRGAYDAVISGCLLESWGLRSEAGVHAAARDLRQWS